MKIITIKELSQLYYLNKEILLQQEQLARLEAQVTKCTSDLSGMPKGNGLNDKVANCTADIADLKTLLDLNIRKYYFELNRLNRYIASVDDSLTRMIMTLRFVNGLSWGQVSASVGGNNTKESVKKITYRHLRKTCPECPDQVW